MVKPRSKQAKKPVNADAANALADALADKPYGENKVLPEQEESIERLTIAMPISLYDELEALAKKRKRAKAEQRSMSAIAREAIKEYLGKHKA